ncbi:SsrA-binding protein [Sedimentisphaera cyanobacteriorum]|uniref:SsrA-binding protein n=1 Tax=Sedimentisphaera cyanobacteriorum TaxID=1940790 RepID=A0A1Q2HPC3_9BACT|nr:SsrA-binding protein SmpB [Sedimentisphaera cyanobacteriorum]AQQ09307.1 SsrA-binding protein [Sedimentisphaera cyanobacteriorum]
MAKEEKKSSWPRIKNKKAFHDYEILDKIEAGLELKGSEVKSLRTGSADLNAAYGRIYNNECFLIGCKIEPYKEATYNNHDPERKRKLLLHKAQIKRLHTKLEQKGYSLIPLAIYFNKRGTAKLELALARGKKKHDKRAAIKEKDLKRDMQRYSKY